MLVHPSLCESHGHASASFSGHLFCEGGQSLTMKHCQPRASSQARQAGKRGLRLGERRWVCYSDKPSSFMLLKF